MRDSFVLYTKIKDTVDELTLEQKGELFQAILDYQATGEVPKLEGVVKIAFIPIRQDLDANNEKWEKTRQARSEAGKKSAEQRLANSNKSQQTSTKSTNVEFVQQTGTNSNKQEQTGTNSTDNVNVNVYVNDNVSSKEDIYRDVPEEIKDVYMEWVKMRRKIKKPITSKTTVTRSLNRLRSLSNDPAEQRELIQVAIDHCWQSFYHKPREDTKNRKADELDGFYKMSQEWANE